MQSALLLGLGETGDDLVVDVLLPLQFFLHHFLSQVSQLQLPHQLIHCVSVEEFSVANLADFSTFLTHCLVFVLFGRVGNRLLVLLRCLKGERSGLKDMFRAEKIAAKVTKSVHTRTEVKNK